jgi:hypothetical protein
MIDRIVVNNHTYKDVCFCVLLHFLKTNSLKFIWPKAMDMFKNSIHIAKQLSRKAKLIYVLFSPAPDSIQYYQGCSSHLCQSYGGESSILLLYFALI